VKYFKNDVVYPENSPVDNIYLIQ